MTLANLDRSLKYTFRDAAEIWWRFAFETTAGTNSWVAYRKKPGETSYLAVGLWEEDDVYRYIHQHPTRLTMDDTIDCGAWLARGGLEKLFTAMENENE